MELQNELKEGSQEELHQSEGLQILEFIMHSTLKEKKL